MLRMQAVLGRAINTFLNWKWPFVTKTLIFNTDVKEGLPRQNRDTLLLSEKTL